METITTLASLNEKLNENLVLILAKTHTCSVCQLTESQLNAAIPEFHALNKAQLYIDDVDAFRGALEVFAVPTVMIYANGKELLRESRFINVDKIKRLLMLYQN